MERATLDRVLEDARSLSPDDRRRLRVILEAGELPESEEERERLCDEVLLRLGIIGEIPQPITDPTPYRNRKPVHVKGRPVSETLIEERR